MNKEFKLPDVGEGLTEADIVSWHVKPGDTVTINQVIVEIETAKAVVELPSPYAGTVSALLADEGQTVDVGTPIITVDVPVAGRSPAGPTAPAPPAPNRRRNGPPPAAPAPPRRPASRSSSATASSRARPAAAPQNRPHRPGSYPHHYLRPLPRGPGPPARPARYRCRLPGPAPGPPRALAKPPVGRLARDLGIELWPGGGKRARGLCHPRRCAAGSRRTRTVPHPGLRKTQADGRQPAAASARRHRRPPRSEFRCAGCASTPPRRWWRVRSPRPM